LNPKLRHQSKENQQRQKELSSKKTFLNSLYPTQSKV